MASVLSSAFRMRHECSLLASMQQAYLPSASVLHVSSPGWIEQRRTLVRFII